MNRYHVTRSGQVAPCSATDHRCPLGGEHYPSMREAAIAAARTYGEAITFGKYEGRPLDDLLADKTYCRWLVQQKWFKRGYPRLYRRVLAVAQLRRDFNSI